MALLAVLAATMLGVAAVWGAYVLARRVSASIMARRYARTPTGKLEHLDRLIELKHRAHEDLARQLLSHDRRSASYGVYAQLLQRKKWELAELRARRKYLEVEVPLKELTEGSE